jgi:uroporphyrinogen III methyltransferase/synthase
VAIVRRCSFPDQRVIRCRLDEVARRIDQVPRIRPPAVIIVGAVASGDAAPGWFQQLPLSGKRVLVTRPRHQSGQLAELLEEQGAEVLIQPAIEITPPADWRAVDQMLGRLAEFDWLVFSSSNGVQFLLDRLLDTGRDLRALGALSLAAIGPGTAEALATYRLRADLQPDEFRAEALAAALAGQAAGKRFLLARASRGREVLAEQLRAAGGIVEQVVVYHSSDVAAPEPRTAELLAAGQIGWITVTSSAIAQSLVRLFGDQLRQARLASISPVTSATLRGLGIEPAAEAMAYTMQGVVKAIVRAEGVEG